MDATEAARRHNFKLDMIAFFRARPGEWIDASELLKVGGTMAWRTRCADARKVFRAEGGTLDNRQLRDGTIRSEYRYLPYQPLARSADERPSVQQELFR